MGSPPNLTKLDVAGHAWPEQGRAVDSERTNKAGWMAVEWRAAGRRWMDARAVEPRHACVPGRVFAGAVACLGAGACWRWKRLAEATWPVGGVAAAAERPFVGARGRAVFSGHVGGGSG
jgi:hypothetical protein